MFRVAAASNRNDGAGEESRTLDLNLGKVALYQLSYSRIVLHLQRFAVQHAARKIWSGKRDVY
jgi:hypothetical protein